MSDATTLESMQTISANNQPTSTSDDASASGTYGIIPLFQQIQASLRNQSLSLEWQDLNGLTSTTWTGGLTPTYVSATSFTYQGDQTAYFTANRRVKAVGSTYTIYGYVSSGTYNSGPNSTTVVVVWDSGSLDNTVTDVYVASLNAVNMSIPTQVIATVTALNNQSAYYGTAATGTNTYATTVSPAPANQAALVGKIIVLQFTNTNTGAATLNVNSLGAQTLVKNTEISGGGVNLVAGDIQAGQYLAVVWNGANYQLVSPNGNIIDKAAGDARYAALAGSASQAFSVANASGANQAVALGQFVTSGGSVKLPNGLIINLKSGFAVNTATAVTWDIAFTLTTYSVACNPFGTGGTIAQVYATNKTTSGATINAARTDTGAGTTASVDLIAIGT